MQAGEKLLLPCGGKEIFLFLMARQVHHPGSDVGCYDNLRREGFFITIKTECSTLGISFV